MTKFSDLQEFNVVFDNGIKKVPVTLIVLGSITDFPYIVKMVERVSRNVLHRYTLSETELQTIIDDKLIGYANLDTEFEASRKHAIECHNINVKNILD